MKVPREVVLDLLPLYLAGEASPATRALVEEFLQRDPALAERVRGMAEGSARPGEAGRGGRGPGGREGGAGLPHFPPPELELRSLRRTRRQLALLRWLFGLGIGFTAIALTSQFSTDDGHVRDFHFLIRDHPLPFGASLVFGAACWIAYIALRRRLRSTSL